MSKTRLTTSISFSKPAAGEKIGTLEESRQYLEQEQYIRYKSVNGAWWHIKRR
jgi:hypothetical protein